MLPGLSSTPRSGGSSPRRETMRVSSRSNDACTKNAYQTLTRAAWDTKAWHGARADRGDYLPSLLNQHVLLIRSRTQRADHSLQYRRHAHVLLSRRRDESRTASCASRDCRFVKPMVVSTAWSCSSRTRAYSTISPGRSAFPELSTCGTSSMRPR